MKFAVLIFSFLISPLAPAAPGVQEPVHPNYRSHNDIVGLCTADNKKNHYFASGHCTTILEQLTGNECTKRKLEELRVRFLQDEQLMSKMKLKNTEKPYLGFTCSHKTDPNLDIYSIAKDPQQFAIVMMQLFAMIAIEESKWQVNHNGDASQSQNVKCTSRCGLLGLNKSDMEKPKYQCGCKIENKEDNQKQYDPTMDGHLNLRCGVTMALIEATENKENNDLLWGRPKGPEQDKDTRGGFAKIFKSMETPEDKTPDVVDTPKERVAEKMKTYCQTHAFASKNVNEWKRQLQDSKDINSIK